MAAESQSRVSVPVSMMRGMWIAQDDRNQTRRISFGDDRSRAEQFVESLAGWSVRSDSDPGWLPLTGVPDGFKLPDHP